MEFYSRKTSEHLYNLCMSINRKTLTVYAIILFSRRDADSLLYQEKLLAYLDSQTQQITRRFTFYHLKPLEAQLDQLLQCSSLSPIVRLYCLKLIKAFKGANSSMDNSTTEQFISFLDSKDENDNYIALQYLTVFIAEVPSKQLVAMIEKVKIFLNHDQDNVRLAAISYLQVLILHLKGYQVNQVVKKINMQLRNSHQHYNNLQLLPLLSTQLNEEHLNSLLPNVIDYLFNPASFIRKATTHCLIKLNPKPSPFLISQLFILLKERPGQLGIANTLQLLDRVLFLWGDKEHIDHIISYARDTVKTQKPYFQCAALEYLRSATLYDNALFNDVWQMLLSGISATRDSGLCKRALSLLVDLAPLAEESRVKCLVKLLIPLLNEYDGVICGRVYKLLSVLTPKIDAKQRNDLSQRLVPLLKKFKAGSEFSARECLVVLALSLEEPDFDHLTMTIFQKLTKQDGAFALRAFEYFTAVASRLKEKQMECVLLCIGHALMDYPFWQRVNRAALICLLTIAPRLKKDDLDEFLPYLTEKITFLGCEIKAKTEEPLAKVIDLFDKKQISLWIDMLIEKLNMYLNTYNAHYTYRGLERLKFLIHFLDEKQLMRLVDIITSVLSQKESDGYLSVLNCFSALFHRLNQSEKASIIPLVMNLLKNPEPEIYQRVFQLSFLFIEHEMDILVDKSAESLFLKVLREEYQAINLQEKTMALTSN